jgi:hypothetical protein
VTVEEAHVLIVLKLMFFLGQAYHLLEFKPMSSPIIPVNSSPSASSTNSVPLDSPLS